MTEIVGGAGNLTHVTKLFPARSSHVREVRKTLLYSRKYY